MKPLIEKVKNKLLERAISLNSLGIREAAWRKHDALELIKFLMKEHVGILGGDVYEVETKLKPLPDNWHSEPSINEGREEFFLRSKIESLNYIANYPKSSAQQTLFSLVFTEQFDLDVPECNSADTLGAPRDTVQSSLSWLMEWYHDQTGGACSGFQVSMADGPSWHLTVDLRCTPIVHKAFSEITTERSQNDWICCYVQDGIFQGYSGTEKLPELLQIFHDWVTAPG